MSSTACASRSTPAWWRRPLRSRRWVTTSTWRGCVALNRRRVARVSAACRQLGLGVIPSVGNFVLVDMGAPAAPLFEALLRRGVIVRPVGNYGLPQHLRISIGAEPENDRLIAALTEVLQR